VTFRSHTTMKIPSLRARVIAAMMSWLLSGLCLVSLMLRVDRRFAWLLVAVFAAIGIYLSSLRCPSCGSRIMKWGGWPPKRCPECGLSLS